MPALELPWLRVVTGERRGCFGVVARGLLRAMSWGYGGVIRLRSALYDRGWLPSHRLAIPVISVGNLAVGGSGKTPLVELLARQLQSHRRVAIVSRGYGGTASGPMVVSAGRGPLQPPSACGDEPYLLAQNLTGVLVIVGRDRVRAGQLAQQLGAGVIILDDGMQHRRLARDVELVLRDRREPQALFPRGLLREPLSAARRADLIIWRDDPNAPVSAHLQPAGVHGEVEWNNGAMKGRRVGLFCGIGAPHRFYELVAALGAQAVVTLSLADHQGVEIEQLEAFAHRCQQLGAEALLCTQKDWVKLPTERESALPIGFLKVEMELLHGSELLQQILAQRLKCYR